MLVGDVVDEAADVTAEPMVVGAAGDQHRGPLTRLRTWAHRDEPVANEMLMLDPSVDPEELRYAPRAPRRLLWLRRTAFVVVVLAIIGGGLAIAYSWSQTQYFVSDHGDRVAIYRGVDAQLPGVSLNHVYAGPAPEADRAARLPPQPGEGRAAGRQPGQGGAHRRRAPRVRQDLRRVRTRRPALSP